MHKEMLATIDVRYYRCVKEIGLDNNEVESG